MNTRTNDKKAAGQNNERRALRNAERTIGGAPPTTHELLRIVRAAQPISRTAVARRLGVTRGTVTVLVKPLLDSGALREAAPEQRILRRVGRPPIGLSLRAGSEFLIGINIGVSEIVLGATTPAGQLLLEDSFRLPEVPKSRWREYVVQSRR